MRYCIHIGGVYFLLLIYFKNVYELVVVSCIIIKNRNIAP